MKDMTMCAQHGDLEGLAQALVDAAEELARSEGYQILNLDVRATQDRAIRAFEARGYQHFGTNPYYAMVGDEFVPGLYFTKQLKEGKR